MRGNLTKAAPVFKVTPLKYTRDSFNIYFDCFILFTCTFCCLLLLLLVVVPSMHTGLISNRVDKIMLDVALANLVFKLLQFSTLEFHLSTYFWPVYFCEYLLLFFFATEIIVHWYSSLSHLCTGLRARVQVCTVHHKS